MDSNREQSVHGAPANHIVASATCLSEHFSSDHFDVVICNGVYGWGLDSSEDKALFARGLRTILKPGGLFVFGFNAPHDPINIRVCSKMVFRNLDRVSFIGTDIRVFNNYQHHSFIFFRKPERPRKG